MYLLEYFKNRYILLCLVFAISFTIHLIGINKIGRTWDEPFKVDSGYMAISNISSGDFSVNSWNLVIEHPMVGKYAYGLVMGPQVIRIDDGNGNIANISQLDIEAITNGNYIKTQLGNKLYMVGYDYTMARILSATFNSLTVTFTVLISLYFLNIFWAFLAGMFMLLIPRFVVMGQLVTFESITAFLFLSTLLVFYKLLNNPKKLRLYFFVGILCGLLFWTRYNNYFVFLFLAGWMVLDFYFKKNKAIFNYRLILIPIIAFLLGIFIWPIIWHDFPKYLLESFLFHKDRIIPSIYYLNRFIVTTPIPILVGLILGLIFCLKQKKYWNYFFMFWFISVLIYHMIVGVPGGGTRFIFIIYPAVGVLCAFGYSMILRKKWIYALLPLFAYMIIDMISYHPYYLDYYNMLIGGVKGASKLNYEVSWWGEGQRGVGLYVNKNIPQGASVGYFVVPRYVAPNTRFDLNNVGFIDDNNLEPDYVMVSRWRLSEFQNKTKDRYEIIYSEKVRGEDLVLLLKKK